jgi:hypothetical protein
MRFEFFSPFFTSLKHFKSEIARLEFAQVGECLLRKSMSVCVAQVRECLAQAGECPCCASRGVSVLRKSGNVCCASRGMSMFRKSGSLCKQAFKDRVPECYAMSAGTYNPTFRGELSVSIFWVKQSKYRTAAYRLQSSLASQCRISNLETHRVIILKFVIT